MKKPKANNKQAFKKWRRVIIWGVIMTVGILSVAYAQSARNSVYDLSSPVSFPVDI